MSRAGAEHYLRRVMSGDARGVGGMLLRGALSLAGFPLEDAYPALRNCLLVAATELTTDDDVARLVEALEATA